jgi:hypothetical protein
MVAENVSNPKPSESIAAKIDEARILQLSFRTG